MLAPLVGRFGEVKTWSRVRLWSFGDRSRRCTRCFSSKRLRQVSFELFKSHRLDLIGAVD